MIFIYGCGGHGKVILDALVSSRIKSHDVQGFSLVLDEILFVDDRVRGRFSGRPVISPKELGGIGKIYIAIGDNCTREKIWNEHLNGGLYFPALIAPSAVEATFGDGASIGRGSQILSQTYVGPGTNIGIFTIINNGASVDHDCSIGSFSHIAPGAHLCGNVKVGDRTLVGVGTSVIPGIDIGSDCIIGAGSVVVSDIPDNAIAFGNPCKVIKENHQLHY